MRLTLNITVGALLAHPLLGFASAQGCAPGSLMHVTPLIAWLAGPYGIGLGALSLLLGAFTGTGTGSPTPPLEGVALAGALNWLPPVLEHFPADVQILGATLLLCWIGTFVWALVVFALSGRLWYWQRFSFVELLTRLMKRKEAACAHS